jgi:21S rRNA (uridine2791-2'-O)-methyltransferase
MLARAVTGLPAAFRLARCEPISLRPLSRPAVLAYVQTPHQTVDARGKTSISRNASTSSSTRWKARQSRDTFAREAKVAGLKSRAAFKLLEINEKHRLFKRGDTVVDLGYAPGSWSQVAINRTQPGGRVIGIDIIPAQPPRGVSTIQGDFLSEEVREEVRRFVQDPQRGRARTRGQLSRSDDDSGLGIGLTEEELEEDSKGLIERERELDEEAAYEALDLDRREKEDLSQKELDAAEGRVVNVILSDMSEPWPLTASTWIKSVSNPYHRMMNTSGMAFRDHAGSMVLSNPPVSHLS